MEITMKLKVLKLLTGVCLLSLHLSSFSALAGGSMVGGGGDASEERVNEIRADILKWIKNDGAKGLTLPKDISYNEYLNKMTEILEEKKVIIEFTNDEVKVNDRLKTCKGTLSKDNSKPSILCNIERFKNTFDSDQYKLIHHEYAGLVNIENNEGAASDYMVSSQITDFLSYQEVLKLAVKKNVEKSDINSSAKVNFEDLRDTDINLNSRIIFDGVTAKRVFEKLKTAIDNGGIVNEDGAMHREILSTEGTSCVRSYDGNNGKDHPDYYYCSINIK